MVDGFRRGEEGIYLPTSLSIWVSSSSSPCFLFPLSQTPLCSFHFFFSFPFFLSNPIISTQLNSTQLYSTLLCSTLLYSLRSTQPPIRRLLLLFVRLPFAFYSTRIQIDSPFLCGSSECSGFSNGQLFRDRGIWGWSELHLFQDQGSTLLTSQSFLFVYNFRREDHLESVVRFPPQGSRDRISQGGFRFQKWADMSGPRR